MQGGSSHDPVTTLLRLRMMVVRMIMVMQRTRMVMMVMRVRWMVRGGTGVQPSNFQVSRSRGRRGCHGHEGAGAEGGRSRLVVLTLAVLGIRPEIRR